MAYNAKGKNGIRVEPCPKCGATFDKIFRRNEHVERCNRVFNCERCGKPFKSKQALTGHFNGKHTEKFKCESCGKCFESSSKLDRHKRTHDEAKNFTCSQCGKTFKRNDNMVKHIRVIHKV
uniref:C2H2-type domain-containing protein n=1 Tax=Clytia hemisphaerica TaxID=252671 RepID=A0A7M5V4A3_9CNID